MKIAFIGQKGIPAKSGGVERHVHELATRLVKEGHEVICYCRGHYTPTDLKEYAGVKLIHLPTIKTKHLDALVHTFLASIDVLFRRVDIIHYHAIGPSALLWIPKILVRGVKIVSTFHSDDRKHGKWGWFARKCLGIGAYISLRFPHKAIAVSKSQKQLCEKEFGGEPVYIPNGVIIDSNNKEDNTKILEQFGLTAGNYILTVSRLVRHKGTHYLIDAYKNLGDKTDKKLVIVGGSNYTDEYVGYLKELAQENKNIIFTGEQSGRELQALYRGSYLFVLPSEAEGLSIALLEAMAYGKTVLASDIPENKEVVQNAGFTFRSQSVADLTRKLKFLIDSPELVLSFGQRAKEQVEEKYNWDKIMKEVIAVYEDLLNEREVDLVPLPIK